MTEDEAFIRSVVGSRGDNTPRLAYADWLDDRGEPRGPYLRAAFAAADRDAAQLREAAIGLDPVWVARVSRPPVGVCCDVEWSTAGEDVCSHDLEEFERRFGITLPVEYRAFLLNSNGGTVEFAPLPTPTGTADRFCGFHSLAKTTHDDPEGSLEYEFNVTRHSLYRRTRRDDAEYHVRLLRHMIIGWAPGRTMWVVLGFEGQSAGRIRFLDMARGYPPGREGSIEPGGWFESLPRYLAALRADRA
ncbi:TIGR02996 domain-containing protein [Gemmata sp.]|uniref:TIGR02996 domain-containing protein n=1 Tax=Gemmata sp. TaxID=1914242 RepID=UPI003F6FADE7